MYIIEIDHAELADRTPFPSTAHTIGPFASRGEASRWAESVILNGSWTVVPVLDSQHVVEHVRREWATRLSDDAGAVDTGEIPLPRLPVE